MSLEITTSELTAAEIVVEFIALLQVFFFFYTDASIIWHRERKQREFSHCFIRNSH